MPLNHVSTYPAQHVALPDTSVIGISIPEFMADKTLWRLRERGSFVRIVSRVDQEMRVHRNRCADSARDVEPADIYP